MLGKALVAAFFLTLLPTEVKPCNRSHAVGAPCTVFLHDACLRAHAVAAESRIACRNLPELRKQAGVLPPKHANEDELAGAPS